MGPDACKIVEAINLLRENPSKSYLEVASKFQLDTMALRERFEGPKELEAKVK